ncbi:hypothetical protein ACFV6F_20265 [Kitasatospora phosalacinea]|uniref:hypothetical protein n=1 Tax=Kitasatospora phosalacinea TaxID=2065 RepID=UPI00364A32F2
MQYLKAVVAAAAVALLSTSCVRVPGPMDGLPTNEAASRQVIAYDTEIRRAMFGEGQAETPVRKVLPHSCALPDGSGGFGVRPTAVTTLVTKDAEWNKELVAAFERKAEELGFEALGGDEPRVWAYGNSEDGFLVELNETDNRDRTIQLRVEAPCIAADGSASPPAAA